MPLYMTQFAYTPETWAALIRNPQNRGEALGGLLERMGGRIISFYNCFGEYDGLFIYEAPDESTAAATASAAISPGHVKAVKTTTLLSAEDGMEAMRKAAEQTYRRPEQ
jgi:uncharacterized protein with GYD domain